MADPTRAPPPAAAVPAPAASEPADRAAEASGEPADRAAEASGEPADRAAEASGEPADRAAEASGEPAAWAEVEARWAEPAAHQAYLARFPDLEGLASAGRRYRDALAARPGDQVALAMKAEVVKRATVVGLSMLPRTAPPSLGGQRWKRISLLMLAAWLGSALGYFAWKLLTGPRS